MQFFRDYPDGTRIPITAEQELALSWDREYFITIHTPMLKVYRKRGEKAPRQARLFYGGRGNHHNPNGWRGN